MKRTFLYLVLLFILIFYCGKTFSAEDTRKTQSQPLPVQRQQSPRQSQGTKPILPPVTPFSSMVSPTPSPHIAAPPVDRSFITAPSLTHGPVFPKMPIHNMPSAPVHMTIPATNISTELPQVPVIGNSIGKVIGVGREKDGSSWIEVRDEIFDETLKIKVDPTKTPVIKKTTVLSFDDIKIGDTVSVIFNQQGDECLANFVSILTEEDLKAMEESLEKQSTLVPEGDNLSFEE